MGGQWGLLRRCMSLDPERSRNRMGARVMTATNTIDRELNKAELGQSNELRDEELEQVVGGKVTFAPMSITRKIDTSTPTW